MQSSGPFCSCSVTSRPLVVHVPAIDGQPSPDSVNVPAGSKRSVNARITSGPLGSDCCAEGAAVIREPARVKAISARRAQRWRRHDGHYRSRARSVGLVGRVGLVGLAGWLYAKGIMDQSSEPLSTWTQVIYALHAFSLLTGILGAATVVGAFLTGWPSIIAVILNYVKRSEARGTWLESHFRWQIRTFWFGVLWISLCVGLHRRHAWYRDPHRMGADAAGSTLVHLPDCARLDRTAG